jgi:hypothetical protein
MTRCRAPLPTGRPCNQQMYRCTACGARGCTNRECRNQEFESGFARCFRCNATFGITSC